MLLLNKRTENAEIASFFYHKLLPGHLRNDLMTEESFLTVERQEENSEGWLVVARDADWETKLLWTRTNVVTGDSNVQVKCQILTIVTLILS